MVRFVKMDERTIIWIGNKSKIALKSEDCKDESIILK